jgi:hypothetical protein
MEVASILFWSGAEQTLKRAPHQIRAAETASCGNLRRRFVGLLQQAAGGLHPKLKQIA